MLEEQADPEKMLENARANVEEGRPALFLCPASADQRPYDELIRRARALGWEAEWTDSMWVRIGPGR